MAERNTIPGQDNTTWTEFITANTFAHVHRRYNIPSLIAERLAHHDIIYAIIRELFCYGQTTMVVFTHQQPLGFFSAILDSTLAQPV